MRTTSVVLVVCALAGAGFAFQEKPAATKSSDATAVKKAASAGPGETALSAYHAGPWEEKIGYSQAVRAGHTIYISGTVGADEKGFPKDLEAQMRLAYAAIEKTLEQYGANVSDVAMERIYTTDMDALIKLQEVRKGVYGKWLPAATWVEVRRLYVPEAMIEIEVEVVVE